MSFGKCTWDQWKVVESYIDHGNEMMEKFNEFMKKQADLEFEYSKNLQKLVKQYKEEIHKKNQDKNAIPYFVAVQGGSIHQTWSQILDKMEVVSDFHFKIYEDLDLSLRKTRFDEIKKSIAELNKSIETSDKMKQKFEKTAKDLDGAKTALESAEREGNASKKDLEKIRADYEKKAVASYENLMTWKASVNDSNSKKNKYFKETLPNTLDEIQKDDEDLRITFLKESMVKYYDVISKPFLASSSAIKEIEPFLEAINASSDSDTFVSSLNYSEDLPPDYQLFDSSEEENERRRILHGLSKLREEKESAIDDRVFLMPTKDGRKRAVDRVKYYEKDISEFEKKVGYLQNILKFHQEKPELFHGAKVDKDVIEQFQTLEETIISLKLKRHRLQVYIAKCDGVAAPELPENLQKKAAALKEPKSASWVEFNNPLVVEKRKSNNAGWGNQIKVTNLASVSSLPTPPIDRRMIVMIYDFEATPNSEELTVKAGDELALLDQLDDGWWKASIGGRIGFVPSTYCKVLNEENETFTQESEKQMENNECINEENSNNLE